MRLAFGKCIELQVLIAAWVRPKTLGMPKTLEKVFVGGGNFEIGIAQDSRPACEKKKGLARL